MVENGRKVKKREIKIKNTPSLKLLFLPTERNPITASFLDFGGAMIIQFV